MKHRTTVKYEFARIHVFSDRDTQSGDETKYCKPFDLESRVDPVIAAPPLHSISLKQYSSYNVVHLFVFQLKFAFIALKLSLD